MPFKMRGFSPFTKHMSTDEEAVEKEVNSTISDDEAKNINVENISAVQNKNGQNFVVEVGDNEYYDPNKSDFIGSSSDPENMVLGKHKGKKDAIGPLDRTWRGNYNDTNNKRDTILVSNNFPEGHLIDETQWETGDATKPDAKIPPHQLPAGPTEPKYTPDGDCMNCDEID